MSTIKMKLILITIAICISLTTHAQKRTEPKDTSDIEQTSDSTVKFIGDTQKATIKLIHLSQAQSARLQLIKWFGEANDEDVKKTIVFINQFIIKQ